MSGLWLWAIPSAIPYASHIFKTSKIGHPLANLPSQIWYYRWDITDEILQRVQATLSVSEEWARRVIETEQSMDNLREGAFLWPGSFAVPRMLQTQTVTVRAILIFVCGSYQTEVPGQLPNPGHTSGWLTDPGARTPSTLLYNRRCVRRSTLY